MQHLLIKSVLNFNYVWNCLRRLQEESNVDIWVSEILATFPERTNFINVEHSGWFPQTQLFET